MRGHDNPDKNDKQVSAGDNVIPSATKTCEYCFVEIYSLPLHTPINKRRELKDNASRGNRRNPRFTTHWSRASRLQTFTGWPHSTPTRFSLALAGFIYTGRQDLVRCFYCDVGLKDFSAGVDPMKWHIIYSHNCDFLIEVYGEVILGKIREAIVQPQVRVVRPYQNKGAVTTIVLYFAGQSAIDFFYTGTTRDVDGRIHRRQPTDDWYGVFFLRGWAFGFVYITPGIYGIASSLFFNKCLMGESVVVETLAVTAGSFLHSVGALGLLHYYFVVSEGASKHDPFLTDCFFSKMQTTDTYPIQPVPVNERCEQGRKLFASSYTKCLDHRKKILLQRKHRQHVLTVQYGWNQREFAGEDKGRHDRWRRHQTLTDRPTSVWRRVPGLRTPAGHTGSWNR